MILPGFHNAKKVDAAVSKLGFSIVGILQGTPHQNLAAQLIQIRRSAAVDGLLRKLFFGKRIIVHLQHIQAGKPGGSGNFAKQQDEQPQDKLPRGGSCPLFHCGFSFSIL